MKGELNTPIKITTDPVNIHYQGDVSAAPLTFYGTGVCDCGYAGRHSRFRHWFRLRYLKERW
jgi:hypothetical protein